MSKKKLGGFNDLINTYFQSFICLLRYEHFLAIQYLFKSLLGIAEQDPANLERLKETLRSHKNFRSLTDLSGANIGIHSNSKDWLF